MPSTQPQLRRCITESESSPLFQVVFRCMTESEGSPVFQVAFQVLTLYARPAGQQAAGPSGGSTRFLILHGSC